MGEGGETIDSETKPEERKAAESSEEREVQTRRTVSLSDSNLDSPSSVSDAQEEVEEEKNIESETDNPLNTIDEEDMSTSQEVDPLEISPTPVADTEEEA